MNASIPQDKNGSFVNFNTNVVVGRIAAESDVESSSLTARSLNFPDFVMSFLSLLEAPVGVILPIASGVGASFTWMLRKKYRHTKEIG